jgi:hypothetical protein
MVIGPCDARVVVDLAKESELGIKLCVGNDIPLDVADLERGERRRIV